MQIIDYFRHDIYISTNHVGLYEKYGCEFYQMMNDIISITI